MVSKPPSSICTRIAIHNASVMQSLLCVLGRTFAEHAGLADDLAAQRMAQRQHEGEPAATMFDVAYRQRARLQPFRQSPAPSPEGEEVVITVEVQRSCIGAE